MELWIRSQDKKKLCVAKFFELDNDETGIFCFNGESYSIFAGKYKTKERALEVLDEIENILQPKVIWKEPKTDIKYDENFIQTLANDMVIQTTQQVEYDLKQAKQIVYEMPKE